MSKILGINKNKRVHTNLKKLNTDTLSEQYFRYMCDDCGADFVIQWKEFTLLHKSETSTYIGVYSIVCPNCKQIHHYYIDERDISYHWCDSEGNYIINSGEYFYIDNMLCVADFLKREDVIYEEPEVSEKEDNNHLCKSDVYETITQNDVPDTEDFKTDYEANSVFKLSQEEFIQCLNFNKVHSDCMRNPETGLHRFGAIGGGISKRYYINNDKRSVIMKCDYCHKTQDLSDNAETCLTPEEIVKVNERYSKYYYPDKMSEVEYLRFKKFCEDRPDEEISVGFMGTGLGSLINVKSETTSEYADITDTDCW